MAYSKENQNAFSQVKDANNKPLLEHDALITEEQIDILAKDIRDYLGDGGGNFVSYNVQNPSQAEQRTAFNNIFGNGVFEAKATDIMTDILKNSNGVTTYNISTDQNIAEALKKAKHIVYLTPQAKKGQYGIPIFSEYFQDVPDSEIIYRKSTCEDMLKTNSSTESEWRTKYKQHLAENKANIEQSNEVKEREKNKWRFADFYRIAYGYRGLNTKNKHLNGLYGVNTPSSVPTFCEYIGTPLRTFVPSLLADLEDGDILYQPNTGDVYQIKLDNSHTLVNTLMPITKQSNTASTAYYNFSSLYGDWNKNVAWVDDWETTHDGYTMFENDAEIKAILSDPANVNVAYSLNGEEIPEIGAKGINHITSNYDQSYISFYLDKLKKADPDFAHFAFTKKNYIIETTAQENKYLIGIAAKHLVAATGDTEPIYQILNEQDNIRQTNGLKLPLAEPALKVQSETDNIVKSNLTYKEGRFNGYDPVLNDTRKRIFYNTTLLANDTEDPDVGFQQDIIKNYPCGAMAIYCEKIGNYKPRTLWRFEGNTLWSSGIEFPAEATYQRILSTPESAAEIKEDDFIYNPYSGEIRQVSREICDSEIGNISFLTRPVIGYMNTEIDGNKRANGSYLRGAGLHYIIPENDASININNNLPRFMDYILTNSNLNNSEYRLKLQDGNRDVISKWKDAYLAKKGAKVLREDQSSTKITFNTLFLLNKNVLNMTNADNESRRFHQLNDIIPGDLLFEIQSNVCNVYQTTSAPYLYDIFNAENMQTGDSNIDLNDPDNFKKLYVNYMYSRRGVGTQFNGDFNELLLGCLLLTELKNNGLTDPNLSYKMINKNDNWKYQFPTNNASESKHYVESTDFENDWIRWIKQIFPDKDYNTIVNYAKDNLMNYIIELRQRLLTYLDCPIAIDAIPIVSFQFSGSGEGSGIAPDQYNDLRREVNSKYNKPRTGIPLTDLTSEVQTAITTNSQIITFDNLDQELQNTISGIYSKPTTGIPSYDLSADVQQKIAAPNMHYLMDYETITYDNNSDNYVFDSTDPTTSRKNYKSHDLILTPFNDIFEMGDADTITSLTPAFVTKISKNNNFNFTWNDNNYIISDNEHINNHSSFYFEFEDIIKNNKQLILNFTGGELDGYQITGGMLTTGWPGERMPGRGIIIPFLYAEHNYSNLEVKNIIIYYNYDGSNQFYLKII